MWLRMRLPLSMSALVLSCEGGAPRGIESFSVKFMSRSAVGRVVMAVVVVMAVMVMVLMVVMSVLLQLLPSSFRGDRG